MVRGTERKHWIDTVRGICMVAILLFHTEMYYAGRDITPYRCYVHNALATFFFISGYLFCGGRDGGGFRFAHKVKSISRTLIFHVPGHRGGGEDGGVPRGAGRHIH